MNNECYDAFPSQYGDKMKTFFEKRKFCILGVGGVGVPVAELLVRMGVKNICLIDGGKVEPRNINNTILFLKDDIKQNKASCLKDKLLSIKDNLNIKSIDSCYTPDSHTSEDPGIVGDALLGSDVVICCIDTAIAKFKCSDLCKEIIFTATGVEVKKNDFESSIHAAWIAKGDTLDKLYTRPVKEEQGYGSGNHSYASLVVECAVLLVNTVIKGIMFEMDSYHVSKKYTYMI